MKEIEQVLDFMVEIEKLKDVYRKTKPVGLSRFENSAEHSWHVCLLALMMKDYANDEINIDRVIKMLLIHDLGEIYSGDEIIYISEKKEFKDAEKKAIEKVLSKLPQKKSEEFLKLWLEFEEGKTADSKYAKAMDRVPPIFHNLLGEGHSRQKYNIPKEKIFSVNKRINEGSSDLWNVIEKN